MENKFTHEIAPIYNQYSKILILGSFPSVKSREANFFYHHPQNRFWKLLSMLLKENLPVQLNDKKNMLLKHNVALWDVISSCEITGSSDSTIRNVIPNDIEAIIKKSNIQKIFINGGIAYNLYCKYCLTKIKKETIKLPSTSPANASYSIEKLFDSWKVILNDLSQK
ncbi:MAG: DNA-deoxyinosine glycosylase [Fusobacteriaceae bacterium]|jgi:hypoxanthine-DNA glycosylase|nr:DNA-deoxyinosine glycosylase [Fusobacteriaceae bacterium]